MEQSVKRQSVIGGNQFSRLTLLSDELYPCFEVIFGEGDSFREALKLDVDEFIGVKGFKAKGKRISTYSIGAIKELDPIHKVENVVPETAQGTYIAEDEDGGDGSDVSLSESRVIDNVEIVTSRPSDPEQVLDNSSEDLDDPEVDEITGQMSLF